MYILGIETSCDETATSIIKVDKREKISVLSNTILSQIKIHQKYGGVVPEVAAREHVLNIIPVIKESLKKAKIEPKKIDLIAVTRGPGLITSLITGVETAKTLSFAWNKEIIGINHIEGHIYSVFIDHYKKIKFPALILTVSGGHTNLILMNKIGNIKIIGETVDDAAGEAFDKGAKMLNLSYPGGPIISKLAQKYKKKETINLPRPMINSNNFNFSFSGLKTALLYKLQKDKHWKKEIPKYCYSYQQAIIDVLVHKTIKAAKKYNVKTVLLSGGVSANKELQKELKKNIETKLKNVDFFFPKKEYTGDNAAMIAMAGYFKYKKQGNSIFSKIKVDPSLQLR